MADTVTRVTRTSWGQRLRGSIGGVFFGLILIVGGTLLLFWNEGRTVKRRKALEEGASTVVSVGATSVQPNYEGRLVHTSGEATTSAQLSDPLFGVSANALELRRRVEMYQWIEESRSEERTKLGGGTETVTTYSYHRDWRDTPLDSSRFEEPNGHQNPSFPFRSETWVAEPVTLGAFTLSRSFSGQMNQTSPVVIADLDLGDLRRRVDGNLTRQGNTLYIGDSLQPEVGAVRVNFDTVDPATVSVVGRQSSGQIVSHATSHGSDIALLSYGAVAADSMFQQAQQSNTALSWVLRVVGLLVLWLAFGMVLGPLAVFADVLPPVGRLVGMGVGLVALGLAGTLGTVTIALGWLAYRPLLGIGLLLLAAALVLWLIRRLRRTEPKLPPLPKSAT